MIHIDKPTTALGEESAIAFIKMLGGRQMVHCPKCRPEGIIVIGDEKHVPCNNNPKCIGLKESQRP